jgi:hypothetical protein
MNSVSKQDPDSVVPLDSNRSKWPAPIERRKKLRNAALKISLNGWILLLTSFLEDYELVVFSIQIPVLLNTLFTFLFLILGGR